MTSQQIISTIMLLVFGEDLVRSILEAQHQINLPTQQLRLQYGQELLGMRSRSGPRKIQT